MAQPQSVLAVSPQAADLPRRSAGCPDVSEQLDGTLQIVVADRVLGQQGQLCYFATIPLREPA